MYKYVLQVQKKTTRIASRASCYVRNCPYCFVIVSIFPDVTYLVEIGCASYRKAQQNMYVNLTCKHELQWDV